MRELLTFWGEILEFRLFLVIFGTRKKNVFFSTVLLFFRLLNERNYCKNVNITVGTDIDG